MGKSEDLLRMLEPAVRPGNLPAPVRTPRLPIEQRDFESLLLEARESAWGPSAALGKTAEVKDALEGPGAFKISEAGGARESVAGSPATSSALQGLLGVDRIESASLRGLMARLPSSS